MVRWLDVVAVVLLISSTASAQTTLFEVASGEPQDSFARSIANVGDVDRDGFADLGVGAPRSDAAGVDAGAAYVYSGRTGLLLHHWLGKTGAWFGYSLCGAGDVDEDGFADVIIGAPFKAEGHAFVFSGRTGEVLRTHTGVELWDDFGSSVGNVGDIDADGADDLAVSASTGAMLDYVHFYSGSSGALLQEGNEGWGYLYGAAILGVGDFDADGFGDYATSQLTDHGWQGLGGWSYVTVHSGATGGYLLFLVGSKTNDDFFGSSMASPGDLDRDGKSDLWIGAPGGNYARLYSGVAGTRIVQEHHGRGGLGAAVACADVDGDGRRDLLAGAPFWDLPFFPDLGSVQVFSSANGATLLEFHGRLPYQRLGSTLAAMGDLNGDGLEEFAVGGTGFVRVVSPIDTALSSPRAHPLVSTSTGEAVVFELDAGPSHPFLIHLLLGSATGTSPAAPLAPGVELPLVPDWYTQAILQSLGSPVFDGFFGMLDEKGAGSAQLDLSGGVDGSLVGITLHHAFVVFDPSGSAAFVSNALASILLPDPEQVPSCDFPSPPFVLPGVELLFDGSSAVDPNGSSLVHSWDFGDGNTAAGAVVMHAFASQGIYAVDHRVEDENGNVSTCSGNVAVDACFDTAPLLGSWVFDAGGPSNGRVEHFAWDFGDGTSTQGEYPSAIHYYPATGVYTVTLTRTYQDGSSSTCSQDLIVVPTDPATCEIAVTLFFGSWLFDASGPGDGFIEQYAWDFGDGSSTVTDGANVFHHYSGPGTYTVNLTVTYFHEAPPSTCSLVVVVP